MVILISVRLGLAGPSMAIPMSECLQTSWMVDIPPMVKVKGCSDMTIDVTPELAKITGDIALPWGRIVVEDFKHHQRLVSSFLIGLS
ncbi:hypothetical protein O9992_07015 [Vibrio lentus]|nr:hypothetical protein [Vibrio lentus]